MPSECASIGDSPGPTDHLYNAGMGCRLTGTMGQAIHRWVAQCRPQQSSPSLSRAAATTTSGLVG